MLVRSTEPKHGSRVKTNSKVISKADTSELQHTKNPVANVNSATGFFISFNGLCSFFLAARSS